MSRKVSTILALLVMTRLAPVVVAQPLPPAPVPVPAWNEPTPPLVPPPVPPPDGPLRAQPLVAPVVPAPLPYYVPAQGRDPLLDRPEAPAPGFYATVDIGFLGTHVRNRLIAPVTTAGATDIIQLPSARLDGAASPRFELGYRMPDGLGEFLIAYRFLHAEGTEAVLEDVGVGQLHSRLDLQVFDFDYASREFALEPNWDLRFFIGARLANVYFDSQSDLVASPDLGGGTASARSTNHFLGAGPHAGVEVARHLGVPGLSLFGKLEGATLLGRISQGFDEQFAFPGSPLVGGAAHQSGSQAVPMLGLQVGLSWVPVNSCRTRYALGYQYENWWSVGRLGASRGELSDQGVFLRAEFGF